MQTIYMLQTSKQTNRKTKKLYTMQTWKKKILEQFFFFNFLHCFEFVISAYKFKSIHYNIFLRHLSDISTIKLRYYQQVYKSLPLIQELPYVNTDWDSPDKRDFKIGKKTKPKLN